MNYFKFVFQDWQVNKGNAKGRLILILFRMANFCNTRKVYYYLGFFYLLFYKLLVEWFFSVELPWNLNIGKNLRLFHGQALVLASDVIIGENCTLRQSTTIGNKQLKDGCFSSSPIIGNYVDVGSNACIIGPVIIKDHVLIGSGSIVVKDVDAYSTVTGNPGIARKRADFKFLPNA